MSERRWSTDLPKEVGVYWHRNAPFEAHLVDVVDSDGEAYYFGNDTPYTVSEIGGEWCALAERPPVDE